MALLHSDWVSGSGKYFAKLGVGQKFSHIPSSVECIVRDLRDLPGYIPNQ